MFNLDFTVFLQEAYSNETYLDWIIDGAKLTIISSSASWFFALLLGTFIGVLRTLPNKVLRLFAAAYVELFRNIPLIVQLFFWFFVFPNIIPSGIGNWIKQLDPNIQMLTSGILCLATFTSARIAEQVRSGIDSLSGGQKNAALACGFTLPQTYRYILIPQSLRIILPPMTSELLNIFKNSSVLQTIGLMELSRQAAQINDFTAKAYESFIAVTVVYILINIVLMLIMKIIENWIRIPGSLARGG